MKIFLTQNLLRVALLKSAMLLLVFLSACSSAQQDEEKPEVSDDAADEQGEQAGAEGDAEAANQASDTQASAEEDSTPDGSELTETPSDAMPAADAAAPMPTETSAPAHAAMPAGETAAPAMPAAPAASVATGNSNGRVVRYVMADNTTIYAEAKDGAAVVGQLAQGEIIVASIENGWAHVHDGLFIKADQLSATAVGRKRNTPVWQAAH